MITNSTEIVLFDVGGVLIRLAGVEVWKEMSGQTDEAEIWYRWLHCPVVKDFESGRCSVDEFSHRMVETHELSVGPEEFLKSFENWPDGLFDGAREVVEDVIGSVRVGCFSNTNYVHWETQPCNQEAHSFFNVHFLSYKMGLVKPDPEAFDYVIEKLACEPGAIFFMDDNIINVEAALARGINAHVTRQPAGARRALTEHGLIRA